MRPFFGPGREDTLERLQQADVTLPITLGDGAPSYRIDRQDGVWLIAPLVVDSEAAAGLEQAAVDNSGLYTWDFMTTAEPLFSSRSKREFIRWLEMWPWLGTGERRAAPTHPKPDRVELDFEHLALDHRTFLRWQKRDERPAVETIDLEIIRDGAVAVETLDAPAHLWDELLDILIVSFPPPLEPPDEKITTPQIKVPEGVRRQKPGQRNLAPTEPLEFKSVQFLRARVRFEEDGTKREVELEGDSARELLDFVFDFCDQFGVPLPR